MQVGMIKAVSVALVDSLGQIRFSYAVSQDTLEDAVNRVAQAAGTLT